MNSHMVYLVALMDDREFGEVALNKFDELSNALCQIAPGAYVSHQGLLTIESKMTEHVTRWMAEKVQQLNDQGGIANESAQEFLNQVDHARRMKH